MDEGVEREKIPDAIRELFRILKCVKTELEAFCCPKKLSHGALTRVLEFPFSCLFDNSVKQRLSGPLLPSFLFLFGRRDLARVDQLEN